MNEKDWEIVTEFENYLNAMGRRNDLRCPFGKKYGSWLRSEHKKAFHTACLIYLQGIV